MKQKIKKYTDNLVIGDRFHHPHNFKVCTVTHINEITGRIYYKTQSYKPMSGLETKNTPTEKRTAYFEHFSISMTLEEARSISVPGQDNWDNIVTLLENNPEIDQQFENISPDDIRAELKEYGTWDAYANKVRILFLAAGDEAFH